MTPLGVEEPHRQKSSAEQGSEFDEPNFDNGQIQTLNRVEEHGLALRLGAFLLPRDKYEGQRSRPLVH